MDTSVITNSFEETRKLGEKYAKTLKGGEVLALYGDLGSGKTTFMQGLAKGLGVTRNIISPTFIIMRTYEISSLSERSESKGNTHRAFDPLKARLAFGGSAQALNARKGVKSLYHVDLYRIETEKDVEGLGLLELLNDPENIVAIEWPEKISDILKGKCSKISFTYLQEDKRQIVFQ